MASEYISSIQMIDGRAVFRRISLRKIVSHRKAGVITSVGIAEEVAGVQQELEIRILV
jgi:hypothetical protein